MPVIESAFRAPLFCAPLFRAPWWLPGGHLQTLVPRYLRRIRLASERVYIPTPDGDRLAADHYPAENNIAPLVIVSHGLEGSAQSGYVLGFTRAAQRDGFAVLAWNLRSCGDEDNITPAIYHSGCSPDLDAVITWAGQQGYRKIFLVGFSLGGNVTLKWLGEQGDKAMERGVCAAVNASVPVDLAATVETLARPGNWLYHRHFVRAMKQRLLNKAHKYPGHIDTDKLRQMRSLWELDEYFTAPLNGFRDAADYHTQSSSRFFLEQIALPTLLITADNDPFFDVRCYPREQAQASDWLQFEIPATGGHVGFWSGPGQWWLEQRFLAFIHSRLAA